MTTASTYDDFKLKDGEHEFADAFESALANENDRRILIQLYNAAREVRYEELRTAVSIEHKQQFKYAIDRLMQHNLIKRRLVPRGTAGERYESHLSLTHWGTIVAQALAGLGETGTLPETLPPSFRVLIQATFRGVLA